MGLVIRMILYAVFAGLAGAGIGTLDATGDYTVNIDDLVTIVIGAVGYLGTFAASRFYKSRGGAT